VKIKKSRIIFENFYTFAAVSTISEKRKDSRIDYNILRLGFRYKGKHLFIW